MDTILPVARRIGALTRLIAATLLAYANIVRMVYCERLWQLPLRQQRRRLP